MSSLLLKWFYLFEASVLDVELLGVNKVKQLAVLLPEGKKGRKLKRFCGVKENVCRAGVEAEPSVIHVNIHLHPHLSMLLKVYWFPCLVSISKSKERVVVVPRAKLTQEISSKRRCTGGLCT